MGKMVNLTAADGVTISAYRADPIGKPKGAIVVIQEIFGVNDHIQGTADLYAREGYLAIAPAMFDRVETGVDLGYDAQGREAGIALMQKVDQAKAMLDVAAAVKYAGEAGKVGIVGYCWGGTLAFMAAAHTSGIAAAVGYYGGGIAARASEQPKVPLILHFGEKDAHISMADVSNIKQHQPNVPIYTYDADHGFNCEARGSYDKPSAHVARARSLAFFGEHLA